jgi:RNA polymerase sigma-54 factor
VLQGFEPAGVLARDVRECLALQLKDVNRYDPCMAALLDNLDLLARRDMNALRKAAASTTRTCARWSPRSAP